jgi:hypothetical protein
MAVSTRRRGQAVMTSDIGDLRRLDAGVRLVAVDD